jgi:hypothetical protein
MQIFVEDSLSAGAEMKKCFQYAITEQQYRTSARWGQTTMRALPKQEGQIY